MLVQARLDFCIALYEYTPNVIDKLQVRFGKLSRWLLHDQKLAQKALDRHLDDTLSKDDGFSFFGLQHPCLQN